MFSSLREITHRWTVVCNDYATMMSEGELILRDGRKIAAVPCATRLVGKVLIVEQSFDAAVQ